VSGFRLYAYALSPAEVEAHYKAAAAKLTRR
jgi:hypothetical protein